MESGEGSGWGHARGTLRPGSTPAPLLPGCVTSACLALGSLIRPREKMKQPISWAVGRTTQS